MWKSNRLRQVTLIGLAVVLLGDLIWSARIGSGFGVGLVVLIGVVVIGAVIAVTLMPRATSVVARNPDVLLPLGLLIVANKVVEWLGVLPGLGAMFTSSTTLRLINMSVGLSLQFLVSIALAIGYAAWMTNAILRLVRHQQSDPAEAWPSWRLYARVFGVEFIWTVILMVGTSLCLMTIPILQMLALVLMGVFGLILNFATAAVLPVAGESTAPFGVMCRAGVNESRAGLRRWWKLLLAQLLLLGMVFFYMSVRGGNTNVSWSINVFWIGGYESDCRWYSKLAEAFRVPQLPLIRTLLTVWLGALVVAVKFAIVQRMDEARVAGERLPVQ